MGPGRYGDAIEMIEACIDKARLNVQDIQETNLGDVKVENVSQFWDLIISDHLTIFRYQEDANQDDADEAANQQRMQIL